MGSVIAEDTRFYARYPLAIVTPSPQPLKDKFPETLTQCPPPTNEHLRSTICLSCYNQLLFGFYSLLGAVKDCFEVALATAPWQSRTNPDLLMQRPRSACSFPFKKKILLPSLLHANLVRLRDCCSASNIHKFS